LGHPVQLGRRTARHTLLTSDLFSSCLRLTYVISPFFFLLFFEIQQNRSLLFASNIYRL